MNRFKRSRRTNRRSSCWPLRLAILSLVYSLLTLAALPVWGQLAPQPDAPPGQGESNFPPLQQPTQPQPETQPPAPTLPRINSQQPPSAQPRANPTQAEPANPPPATASETPGTPQSKAATGIPTLHVSVNLVDLFFVVHDKSGKLVPNLTRADCNVFEDDKPQILKSFTAQSDLPLSIGILLDTSLSQERVLPEEQKAASAFLQRILRPTDEAFLISFDVTVDLLADWTSDPDALKQALDAARINSSSGNYANGTLPSITKPKGTLLYDAVYLASNDKLRQESGRKAMVLLTDGQDEGSDEKLQSAIEAAQKADAVVYVLLISDSGVYGTLDFSSDGAMRKLVEATGGEVFPIGKNGKKLPAAFDAIEGQMRTEYQATYTPSNAVLDGSYRHIRVTCRQNGKDLKVQARQGYYAVAH
ncbi:MAG TPA: VWA domain-containing protein [Acidobacteriaceae bacterium]|nr:VWA domain-containing protein [Acidobacteriaceae bacterium]